ncbi:MAG: transglycosylase domain-containing protein [Verrucomicrobia bacterium]|nr:transglycosylase domain-containing protein [Verrucomicrobiota bacterium]
MTRPRLIQCFVWFSAAVLTLAFSSKLWSLVEARPGLDGIHPLFPFASNRQIASAGVLLELAVLAGIAISKNPVVRIGLPTSLFSLFLVYRVGLYTLGQNPNCACFGQLHHLIGLDESVANGFGLLCCVALPPLGTVLLILEHRTQKPRPRETIPPSARTPIMRRFAAKCLLLFGCVLSIPPIQSMFVMRGSLRTTMPAFLYNFVGKSPESRNASMIWSSLDRVPTEFTTALIKQEDGYFCNHHGFNLTRVGYALRSASVDGSPPHGASTITQQCARSLFLWQGRSWIRKGLELYYSICMEVVLSKRRIFEIYLNVIEFDRGVYGLQAGALHHFGKDLATLTPDEMSRLIAIMPCPRGWHPFNLPPSVEYRRLGIERDITTLKHRAQMGRRIEYDCLREPEVH